jgi:PII-like signaling protein
LLSLSADRPVTITVVDTEQKILEIVPEVRTFVREGLILLLRAELVPLVPDETT